MSDRHTSSRRTDYELTRPAPHALTSLAVAALLLVTLTAALAAPAVTAVAVVATPVVLLAVQRVRRRRPVSAARALAFRVESLLPAALQR
jgi:hypothetical protein